MKPIMQAQEVVYSYPGTEAKALEGLTLSIPEGKKTAICGHNGSGKSTLFLQTIGIHRPASGQMLWKGEPLSYSRSSLKQLRERVGLVFQDPEQQLVLSTPREDISYGLRNAGVSEPEIARRTGAIMSSMGLAALADRPIHQLSLGQKKRVALAGVLVLEPELVLLDEPTAYLDRQSEQQLLEELERIHRTGITVVLATHDMNLAFAWADWVLVMDKGRCVREGTPMDVFGGGDDLRAIGLELPMLLELWNELPEAMRRGAEAPRNLEDFKRWIRTALAVQLQR
ncbi:energy-coupling factor ABC transporter ATP-binding protein [Paenibacillus doosanensis]|uniref:energy-coupling factor ABC transporter ATP-binding protein n=1 Tax=Paenibacillus doosanensis TaxID=1229154 RepID=UPI0021807664|nr:ABC transporter ATP-binding protein [Paenibacillus doosanensis]MCS7464428.1 energy-coupling factor ABC transporter ATP-binding protein [Paenibacillus doosanensis]